MPAYSIRPATERDVDTLALSRVKLFQEIGHVPPESEAPAFQADCRQAFAGYLASGVGVAWFAEAEEMAIGSIVMLLHPRLPSPRIRPATEGYILNVYVEPEWRRLGIGTALTKTALDHARSLGLARLRLHATPAGRPTYSRAGFRPREDEMELVIAREREG